MGWRVRYLWILLLACLSSPAFGQGTGRGVRVASSPAPAKKVALGEYRALIIGINDYANPKIWSPLRAARADAEALRMCHQTIRF